MSTQRAARLRDAATRRRGAAPAPVHWPSLTTGEACEEWAALREWVEQLRVRFPHTLRLPDCWWQHNDLVEILAALRDCEAACYDPSASATAPVEWHRALRDMEARIEVWVKRLTCSVGERGHHRPEPAPEPPGWATYVADDTKRRESSD